MNYYNQQEIYVMQPNLHLKPKSTVLSRSVRINELHDSTDVTHSSIATHSVTGSNNRTNYQPQPIMHLDLQNFKCHPCKNNTQHNHKHCPFYHNAKDRKRQGNFYSADMCVYIERGEMCPYGEQCNQSHNRVEQLYQVDKYKTKFCTCYPHNLKNCEYENFCSFAHSENDIVIELIHNYEYDDDFYMFYFKTVWCPFNLTQHDKALCVYAHNWQDYRRKPNICQYESQPCPYWKPQEFIINYDEGCINGFSCNKCHGWKEQEYHPKNYKTKACVNSGRCNKGKDCPNFHSQGEKRILNNYVTQKIFKYVPKNRIVANTFKVRKNDRQMNQNSESFMVFQQVNNNNYPTTTNNSSQNVSEQQQPQGAGKKIVGSSSQNIQYANNINNNSNQILNGLPEDQILPPGLDGKQSINQKWINQDQQLNDSMSMHEDENIDYVEQRMVSTQESSTKKYNQMAQRKFDFPRMNMNNYGSKFYQQQMMLHPMHNLHNVHPLQNPQPPQPIYHPSQIPIGQQQQFPLQPYQTEQFQGEDQIYPPPQNFFYSDFSIQGGFIQQIQQNHHSISRKRSKSFNENSELDDSKNVISPMKEYQNEQGNLFDQENYYRELSRGVNQMMKNEFGSNEKPQMTKSPGSNMANKSNPEQNKQKQTQEQQDTQQNEPDENYNNVLDLLDEP